MGTPIFTLSEALFPAGAKNGLRNRKGGAASNLGLSSPLDLCRGEWLSSQTRGTASAATPTVPMWGTSPEFGYSSLRPGEETSLPYRGNCFRGSASEPPQPSQRQRLPESRRPAGSAAWG